MFDPKVGISKRALELAKQHASVDRRFEVLSKMPLVAKKAASSESIAIAETAQEYAKLSMELKHVTLGEAPILRRGSMVRERGGQPKRVAAKKSGRAGTPANSGSGGSSRPPRVVQKSVSAATRMINEQLREYRLSEAARAKLKSKAEAYQAKISFGGEKVLENKRNAYKPEIRKAQVAAYHETERKKRQNFQNKRAVLAAERIIAHGKFRKEVEVRAHPDFVKNRKLAAAQRQWFRLLSMATRTFCMADSVEASHSPLDFDKMLHLKEEERKAKEEEMGTHIEPVSRWIQRRHILRTRASVGTLWRCLVLQSLLDRFRDHLTARDKAIKAKLAEPEYELESSSDAPDSDDEFDMSVVHV